MESLIGRAKDVLFEPRATFKEVDSEFTKPGAIWGRYVLPLALIGPLAGAVGRLVFGRRIGGTSLSEAVSINGAVMYFVVALIVTLVGLFVLAQIISLLAPGFGGQKNDVQALKVAAYASTAMLIAGIFNIHGLFWWLTPVLSLYSLVLLYVGLPILMKAPHDRAMGYTAVVIIAAIVIFLLESVKDYIKF
jgi:Yip1 domain